LAHEDNKVIIFDVDGTLANGDHRTHLLGNRADHEWQAYFDASIDDAPHVEIQWLNHLMSTQPDVEIIVLTARTESSRQITADWLAAHDIIYNELILKPDAESGQHGTDHLFKERVLDELIARGRTPFMVFEDRQRVVDMWRRRGIKCLQVQPGDF